MWYFNDDYIHEKGYTLNDAVVLQLLHQNRTEGKEKSLSLYSSKEMLEKFSENGLITSIKKKRVSDSDFSVLRITKKGRDLLDCFGTPKLTVGDSEMFDFLAEAYLRHEDEERTIGNKKKTREYCAIFRQKLSLTLHEMYYLCQLFLAEYKFTKVLEKVFFDKNLHRYGTFESNFEDAKLLQYLEENREKVEKVWDKHVKDRK